MTDKKPIGKTMPKLIWNGPGISPMVGPKSKYKCCRCDNRWWSNQKEGRKLGWRFHGKLQYCPDHKQFQYSLADRDA